MPAHPQGHPWGHPRGHPHSPAGRGTRGSRGGRGFLAPHQFQGIPVGEKRVTAVPQESPEVLTPLPSSLCTPSRGVMGQRGFPQLPLTKQIWGRGWRGRKRTLGARTMCLGTPGCGGSGGTHSVPLLSWLLDALSWWSPWSYRSRGAWQPVAALGQQRRQAWWQVVAEGHLSPPPLHPVPCTPTQDITGSPGGPGCPGRPCGDKSSDQHPLRAVTGRIWGHEAPPQLQGGTPKHLPPLQGPLYRPARGQSKGVRGCTPLPAPRVGKTRSPRCPLSPPLARGRSPWGTARRRALAPAPAGETRGGRINPGRENPKTTPPPWGLLPQEAAQPLTLVEMMVQRSSVSSPSSSCSAPRRGKTKRGSSAVTTRRSCSRSAPSKPTASTRTPAPAAPSVPKPEHPGGPHPVGTPS